MVRMKYLTLLFCAFFLRNLSAQKVLQELSIESGTFFASEFDLSDDNNTLAVSNYDPSGQDVFFYDKLDGEYVLSGSLNSNAIATSPSVHLSADGSRCLLLDTRGIGSAIPSFEVYERTGSNWLQIGQRVYAANNVETNARESDIAISADGNTVLFGEPRSNNNSGSARVFEFVGGEWEQKGQAFSGTVGVFLGQAIDLSSDGDALVMATSSFSSSTENGIVTTWDFINDQWTLRPSIIEEEFSTIQLSGDGNTIMGSEFGSDAIIIYHYANGEWTSNELPLWPEHVPSNNWAVGDLNMTADATSFAASFINPGSQQTAVCMFTLNDDGDWYERKINITTNIQDNYEGVRSEISSDGNILFYNHARFDSNQGKLVILEDERVPLNYFCAYADINCNGQKDDLEYFIPHSIFETNDEYIYFGGYSEYVRVDMEEGENKVEFINSIFEYPDGPINFNAQYLYQDTLCLPVKFIDENTVHVEALAFADTYVCNRSTDFIIDVTNLSPRHYKVNVDFVMTSIGEDVIDSLLSFRELGVLEPLESAELELEIDMPSEDFTGDILGIKVIVYVEDIATGEVVDSNIIDLSNLLRCSYDPNDKAVFPVGIGENEETLFDQSLHYRIRFQNTGNFPATDVIIKDQLDEDLDWNSLKVVRASHDLTSVSMLDGQVSFNFEGIELADSVSNEPMSHGYVMFIIDHKADLPENTEITNFAEIFFDQNAAIVTNETKNTLVSEIGLVNAKHDIDEVSPMVYPNPASNQVFVESDMDFESVEIYNLQGELIASKKIRGNSFDISNIDQEGVLLLMLKYADGVQAAKVIKY